MIVICDPTCKDISHEKVNSGFLYGFTLAYPKEKIVFFSDTSHFKGVKDIFKDSKIPVNNLKHIPINFDADKSFSIVGIFQYYFLFKNIFNKTISFGQRKIFILSSNPVILYVIKKLKQKRKYKEVCCTFVLHGELEDIANVNYKESYKPLVINRTVKLTLYEVLLKLIRHWKKIPLFVSEKMSAPINNLHLKYSLIYKKMFRIKDMLMWQHSNQYKYILLSPHIKENAKKYIDCDYLNFHSIILPIIFKKPYLPPDNKFIKFAVFGYGDSVQMQKMLPILSKKKISKLYEIRIVSMDSRGTEGFPNITRLSQGKVLTRKEMEDAIPDIDVFINLYDKNRHRFGCSLSIFEAFSYLKPVLHLSNPGYNYFNKFNKPIGFRTKNLNNFVQKMKDMIENYPGYKKDLSAFRKNMLDYRKEYDIKNNLDKLKKSFTF